MTSHLSPPEQEEVLKTLRSVEEKLAETVAEYRKFVDDIRAYKLQLRSARNEEKGPMGYADKLDAFLEILCNDHSALSQLKGAIEHDGERIMQKEACVFDMLMNLPAASTTFHNSAQTFVQADFSMQQMQLELNSIQLSTILYYLDSKSKEECFLRSLAFENQHLSSLLAESTAGRPPLDRLGSDTEPPTREHACQALTTGKHAPAFESEHGQGATTLSWPSDSAPR